MEHDDSDTSVGFADLGLRPELLESLANLGYEEPTPIQREAIPLLLTGRDLLGQAATGTGKTAAFALPILQMLTDERPVVPRALVLVPTRELAMQVSEAIYKYGQGIRAQVAPIYGGQHIGRQLDALRRGVHVIVATPGRALDHIRRGTLGLGTVKLVVLDEADEMMDMGFADELEAILEAVPPERQTVLFSATMPHRIEAIARKHQRNPLRVAIGAGKPDPDQAPLVRQSAYLVSRAHKPAALGRILDIEEPTAAIVFCRTRTEVDQLTETMNGRGYRAEALHGGISQDQRDRVMGRLRSGATELLVATDVAARGLDIDQLTHVVNYDVPSAPEAYVHRIGRVGRAGREGVAITMVELREKRLLSNIERLTNHPIKIEKIPTVADLRARQMNQTIATVSAAIGADDLNDYRAIVSALRKEHDINEIAVAALKLVHEASGANLDEHEIPDLTVRVEREPYKKTPRDGDRDFARGRDDRGRDDRGRDDRGRDDRGRDDRGRDDRGPRNDRDDRGSRGQRDDRGSRGERIAEGSLAKLYVALGKSAGIRPQDLVGAIANETSLSGRDIGAIRIAEHHTVVDIPEGAVDEVVAKLSRTKIKGKKVTVRRFVDYGDQPRRPQR
ncbi:MAG: DEAD/DEAH box helicase [Acidimicrobiia bacterium]